MTPEQPAVVAAELQHVAHELIWIEKLLSLAANQYTGASDQRIVLLLAQQHQAGLVAFTQTWANAGGRPADGGPSLWRP